MLPCEYGLYRDVQQDPKDVNYTLESNGFSPRRGIARSLSPTDRPSHLGRETGAMVNS